MSTEFGMTHEISAKDLTERFILPEQDLARLSFCQSTKAASVFDWIHGLPLTQVDQVSAIFYNALPELARVKTNWESRLSIIETVRTPLHQCMEGLSKRYLNQPLIMPEEAVKTATIAQALQKHLLNAYLVVARDISLNPKDNEHHLAMAIYRALICTNYLLMRSLQLYLPPPDHLWKTAHSLFLLSEYFDVSDENCMDPVMTQIRQGTPSQAYIRLLLLAASRPNQLRQDEIQQVFSLLEGNAQSVKIFPLESSEADKSLISLTLTEHPPLFLSKAKQLEIDLHNAYQLNTDPIVQRLKELSQPSAEQDQKYTASVILHLQTAWRQQSQRSFPRQVTRLNIEVIVGLTNIHYYLAGELPFQVFLQQESSVGDGDANSPFAKRGVQLKSEETDPWDDPFDIKGNFAGKSTSSIEQKIRQQALEQYQGQHQTYSIPLIDKSPGGYGLEWQGEIPVQVKTGELIA